MSKDIRLQNLTHWINQDLPNAKIEVASADASFRRYFRVTHNGISTIAMDAPPEQEDCAPFIDITQRLRKAGIHAPEIIRQDLSQGFLLLEDFGDTPYLDKLDLDKLAVDKRDKTKSNNRNADQLYGDALTALLKIQQADTQNLPEYDDKLLLSEMQLMPEWFLKTHLGITPTAEQQKIIDRTLTVISTLVLQQPQVFVHRDYHSRNLMVTAHDNPGIIDYQDAVLGPITYDLVSLLRDCYISWPNEKIAEWALNYKTQAEAAGLMDKVPDTTFIQWFDMMGLQRHIKVLGIFARLNHRDGKTNYLNDLPLTLHYVMQVGRKYSLVRPLIDLLNEWDVVEKIGDYKT